jgi:hypothetical protein
MQQLAPWRRQGILVGRPLGDLTASERTLLVAAVSVLAGRDPDELDAQLALVARAGPATVRATAATRTTA